MKVYIVFLFALMSCNAAFMVPKKDVIRHQKGYIVFYYEDEEALFFPFKDTVDVLFLNKSHANGYRIDRNVKDLEYLRELAIEQKITQSVLQNNQSIQVDEPVKLIPVDMTYFWGDGWRLQKFNRKAQRVNIRYTFRGREIELIYRIYDSRQIISIVPARKSDRMRVKEKEPATLSN